MAEQGSDSLAEQLFQAIKENDIGTLESTLQRHPELVNRKFHTAQGQTTLLLEAYKSRTSRPRTDDMIKDRLGVVRTLLEKGADTTATGYSMVEYTFTFGLPQQCFHRSSIIYGFFDDEFPLFVAASSDLPIFQELVNAKVSIDQTNGAGQSALHVISIYMDINDRYRKMRILIENGATVDLQDNYGRTPLHYACRSCHEDLVWILLDNGADITVRDNNGLTPLDIAAHHHYYLTGNILRYHKLPTQQVIEAYETAAFVAPRGYEDEGTFAVLSMSTSMRAEHNLPKTILEPLECYGFVKEFETLEELEKYKYDDMQLKVQGILARERIFNGRYVNFMTDLQEGFTLMNLNQGNALIRHHLYLFERNNDYLNFDKVFTDPGFRGFIRDVFHMTNDTLLEFSRVAIESCQRMHNSLQMETKPGTIKQLIRELEQTLLYLGHIIVRLLQKSEQYDCANNVECTLAENFFRELLQKLPAVTSQSLGYHAPLPHVLLSRKYGNSSLPIHWMPYQYKLLKMIADANFDLNMTDSFGNTLLHIVLGYSCSPLTNPSDYCSPIYCKALEDMVSFLLRKGTYVHARNKHGFTAMNLIPEDDFNDADCYHTLMNSIADIIKLHDSFPSLKRLAAIKVRNSNSHYQLELPPTLVKFVDLH